MVVAFVGFVARLNHVHGSRIFPTLSHSLFTALFVVGLTGWGISSVAAQECPMQHSIIYGPSPAHCPTTTHPEHLLEALGFTTFDRTELTNSGYTFSAFAVHDLWENVRGGRRRHTGIMGNLNVSLEVDTEKAGLWNGGTFLIHGLGVYGGRPSRSVGDYQFTSNIDAPDTFEPYQFYYEHELAEDRANIRVGIQDLSLEFAILSYGVQLINSSFSTPPTLTQLPTSFYPTTGLGSRIKVKPTDDLYFMAGVYDGRTVRPSSQRSTDLGISSEGGYFSLAEIGIDAQKTRNAPAKLALGAWYTSDSSTNPSGKQGDSNYGSYLLGEYLLVREHEGTDNGLGSFFQVSQADPTRNFNSWYFGAGFNYKGLIPGREEDSTSIAFNYARFSGTALKSIAHQESNERVIEVAHRARLTHYLVVTPDIQLVANPGFSPGVGDALIVMTRVELAL